MDINSVNSLKSEEHGKNLVQENIEFMARFFIIIYIEKVKTQ
jgi:hypothetical protein